MDLYCKKEKNMKNKVCAYILLLGLSLSTVLTSCGNDSKEIKMETDSQAITEPNKVIENETTTQITTETVLETETITAKKETTLNNGGQDQTDISQAETSTNKINYSSYIGHWGGGNDEVFCFLLIKELNESDALVEVVLKYGDIYPKTTVHGIVNQNTINFTFEDETNQLEGKCELVLEDDRVNISIQPDIESNYMSPNTMELTFLEEYKG
jgi:hypothetical protein